MKNPLKHLLVFISYAAEDKEQAKEIALQLKSEGFSPWVDKEQLVPGQDWQLEIEKAVDKCDAIIILLSSVSVTKKGFVQKEIKKALDVADLQPEGTIFILPARLTPCEVPRRLKDKQWVDLFEPDGMDKLIKALELRANELKIPVSKVLIREICGNYIARGNNSNGTYYQGNVSIARQGDHYQIKWHIGSDIHEAKGYKKGGILEVLSDQLNFEYVIEKDGKLRGEWKQGAIEELIPISNIDSSASKSISVTSIFATGL